jgi:hypothetical protein
MSTGKNPGSETPAADAPVTTTTHHEAAQAIVEQLQRMRETIPHFAVPTVKRARQALVAAASLPPKFIELTTVARTNFPALVRGEGTTPAEARDLMEFAEAYAPLADQFEAMAQFIRFTADVAKGKVGREALITYALATRLSRLPEHAAMAPHVADMRRVLGSRVKRVKDAVARKLKQHQKAAAAATPPSSPADSEEQ